MNIRKLRLMALPSAFHSVNDIFSPHYGKPAQENPFFSQQRQAAPPPAPMPAGVEAPPAPSTVTPGYPASTTGSTLDPNTVKQQQQGASPIDKYAQLAKLAPAPSEPEHKQQGQQEQDIDMLAAMEGLDYSQASQAFSKVDFTQGISPELATKALGGDVASFQQLLNQVAASAAAAATSGSSRTTASAMRKELDKMRKGIPDHLKQHQLQNLLQDPTTDDFLRSPAIAPAVQGMSSYFQAQYPHASPAQIQTMLKAWAADNFSSAHQQHQQQQKPVTAPAMTSFFNDI